MTKQELMGKIDELRDMMSKETVGLIDLRRAAERRHGTGSFEHLQCAEACKNVEKIIERMLFGVYHRMTDTDRACQCGQAFQSILPNEGWNAQGLFEDVERNGSWTVMLHNLDEPCREEPADAGA